MVGPEPVHGLHLVHAAHGHVAARQRRGVELEHAGHLAKGKALAQFLQHLEGVLRAHAEVPAADFLVLLQHVQPATGPLGRAVVRHALAVQQVQQRVGGLQRRLGVGGRDQPDLTHVALAVLGPQAGEDRRQGGRQLLRMLATPLITPVTRRQQRLQLGGALLLRLDLPELALQVLQLARERPGLVVIRRTQGGLGDDLHVGVRDGRIGRVVEVGQLLGHLHARLPADVGDGTHLVQVALDGLVVLLLEQPRQLTRDLHPQLVLQIGDLLHQPQVVVAALLGHGREHVAAHVHADVPCAASALGGHRRGPRTGC